MSNKKEVAMKIYDIRDYMKCSICGEYFDMSNLKEVFEHEHTDSEIETGIKGERK